MIAVVISLLWIHWIVPYCMHCTYVPFVLDIGETLQYLFAEREENKEHFVRECGCCMLVCYIMYMHFTAMVFSVLR